MMAGLVGLFVAVPALAEPPSPVAAFAHKYTAVYTDVVAKSSRTLTLVAPSFQTFVEYNVCAPDGVQEELIAGVHQGAMAVVVGAAAGQPVRFRYGAGGRIVLSVDDQSIVTDLSAAQARPMASLVEKGNNGLISIDDVDYRNGKEIYTPKIAESYLNSEEGYWLLWADAMTADLFKRVDFRDSAAPDGLTIVDSERPVSISTDGSLNVCEGKPRIAFWKRVAAERGVILRHIGFDAVRWDQEDVPAVEAVRRLFKWAPVMRLAAKSDPAVFKTFVRALAQVRLAPVSTPRQLIARF
jgi:hypothetical protein